MLGLLLAVLQSLSALADWNQWRGPDRDGVSPGPDWPDSLQEDHLMLAWKIPLAEGYSAPVIEGGRVLVLESTSEQVESLIALELSAGRELWRESWEGGLRVPWYARSRGHSIRSTPTVVRGRIYLSGMNGEVQCRQADTGKALWAVDLPARHGMEVPQYGMAASPLVREGKVFLPATGGLVAMDATSGETLWRTLPDPDHPEESAHASPQWMQLGGKDQVVMLFRDKVVGFDPLDGRQLWSHPVRASHGNNIATPVALPDGFLVSSYGGRTQRFQITRHQDGWQVTSLWSNKLQAYMGSPVVDATHGFLHLRNNRLAVFSLGTGEILWTTDERFGDHWSMVRRNERILALDSGGDLILFLSSQKGSFPLDRRRVSAGEAWAHLAAQDSWLLVRDMQGLSVWRWKENLPE